MYMYQSHVYMTLVRFLTMDAFGESDINMAIGTIMTE